MYVGTDALYTLDPDIKRDWIADLRSGNIRQARGKLHTLDGGMCCLGVLSRRAAMAGVIRMTPNEFHFEYDGMSGNLPQTVCEWAGLTNGRSMTSSGILPFRDRVDNWVYLDSLNDAGMPFDQIADLIEYWY